MTLIIQEPLKIVNGLETKALAARSQLLYQVQREDYEIVDVTDDFGDMRLDLPLALGDITAQFSVGDKVYFKDDNEGLSGEYILKSIAVTGGGFTVLVTETPFTVKSSGFILVLNRQNYHLAVSVIDAETGSIVLERPFKYVLSQSGKANLDFSSIISSYMSAGEDVKLSQEYYLEIVETWTGSNEPPIITTTLQAVYARKQLLSLGGANMWENLLRAGGTYTGNSNGFIYPSNGIPLELQEKPGTNWAVVNNEVLQVILDENVLFKDSRVLYYTSNKPYPIGTHIWNIGGLAKLTITGFTTAGTVRADLVGVRKDFSEVILVNNGILVAANGDFVVSVNNIDLYTTSEFEWIGLRIRFEIGGAFTANFVIDTAQGNFYRARIDTSAKLLTKFKDPLMWRGWKRSASFLIDDQFSNRGYSGFLFLQTARDINKGFLSEETSIPVLAPPPSVRTHSIVYFSTNPAQAYTGVEIRNDTNSLVLSERVDYKVEEDCPNSVMLDWINSLGGIDQHLFSIDQTVSNDSGEGLIAERPVTEDIEFVRRTRRRFPQQASQSIIMTAEHLTTSQLSALHELKETESLRVYLTKDGTEYVEAVVINTYETIHQTRDSLHSITVEVLMPDGFDFFEAKKY